MPSMGRQKTNYPGVFYIIGTSPRTGKEEKIFYIRYKVKGALYEEKVGRQNTDHMTAAKANNIRADKMRGIRTPKTIARKKRGDRVVIDDLFSVFCEHKRDNRSIRFDIGRYGKHVQDDFGDLEVRDIKPAMIYKFRDMLAKSYKPATVKQYLVLIQRIINFGNSLQLCPILDFKIQMPKFDNKVTEDLTKDEQKRLLSVLNDYEIIHTDSANIMRLALFTGLRKGAILGLMWQDIDFERGFITIRHKESKSKVSERVPMNSTARDIFMKMKFLMRESEYVFPSRTGGRLDATAYVRRFQKIRELANLPKTFRPLYGLRHTFASELASTGEVDLYTLQKLMTHKSPDMTQRYAHLRDDTMKRASELMTNALKDEDELR